MSRSSSDLADLAGNKPERRPAKPLHYTVVVQTEYMFTTTTALSQVEREAIENGVLNVDCVEDLRLQEIAKRAGAKLDKDTGVDYNYTKSWLKGGK